MVNSIRLSRLAPDALAALVALEYAGQSHPWRESQLSDALGNANYECWGAWDEQGLLVGHAVLCRLPFEAELQAITVDPRMRRRGVGRLLLRRLVDRAVAWGSERMLLEVRAGNHAAQILYRDCGFAVDARRPNYYPANVATPKPESDGIKAREDALLMSRDMSGDLIGELPSV